MAIRLSMRDPFDRVKRRVGRFLAEVGIAAPPLTSAALLAFVKQGYRATGGALWESSSVEGEGCVST